MSNNQTNINGAPLPPGIWYFSKITDTDHAGYLWIASLMMLVVPLTTAYIRFHVRFGSYQIDDWMLAAGTLISIFEHTAVFVGMRKGLGHASSIMSSVEKSNIDKALFAAEILFIVAHTASKLSVALFIRRLFNNSRRRNAVCCWALIVIVTAWGVISLFTMTIACSPLRYLSADTCPGLMNRWRVVASLDLFSELAIMAVPTYLVSTVMIGLSPKILVVTAFAFRIGPIVFSIVHMNRIHLELTASGEEAGFAYLKPLIWLQVLVGVSLITASIPTFKAFMHPFDDVMMPATQNSSRIGDTSAFGSYLMMGPTKSAAANSKGSGGKMTSGKANQSGSGRSASAARMRPDAVSNNTSVQHGRSMRAGSVGDDSVQSWNSQEGIIRRDQWEIKVE